MNIELQKIIDESWQQLFEASRNAAHAFRNFTIAHKAEDSINIYTVVLREVQTAERQVIFYTDIRSEKITELQADNNISALFYDGSSQQQLVIRGRANIDFQNAISLQHWQKAGHKGRKSYIAQLPPSTPVQEPTDGLAYLAGREFNDNDTDGYQNFAVITITAQWFEYLQLNRDQGNRRARFTFVNSEWGGSWIIP